MEESDDSDVEVVGFVVGAKNGLKRGRSQSDADVQVVERESQRIKPLQPFKAANFSLTSTVSFASLPVEGEWFETVDFEAELADVGITAEPMYPSEVSGKFEDAEFPARESSISGSTRDPSLPPPEPPRCKCSQPCAQKTVYKQTSNTGKRFWCCNSRACNFFQWAPRDQWITSQSNLVWRRPPQWPAYPSVVAQNGFRADDVRQGKLGDCWFLSALSVLAIRPDLVAKLFVQVEAKPCGGPYHVRLFIDGQWRVYSLDDRFPCVKNVQAKTRQVKLNQNESFSLAYCKATRNQLWVPLLEKAYAKAHGCYNAISGGWIAEALFDLTGRSTETIPIGSMCEEELYNILLSFHAEGFPMGASCHNPDKFSGLIGHHAYSILDVRTTTQRPEKQANLKDIFQRKISQSSSSSSSLSLSSSNSNNRIMRLIKLRNPHGKGEWRGPFSRKAPEWTPSLRAELGHTDEDNGTFWMPFDLFLANFCHGTIDVCKAPRRGSKWELVSWPAEFRKQQWWNRCVLEVKTSGHASWVYFSVCQATKRGKVDGQFNYCDVAVVVARLSPEGSLLSVEQLHLPGQCKTHHFEMMLEANTYYAVLTFSLGRSAFSRALSKAANFTVRMMSAQKLQLRTKVVTGPELFISCIHEAVLKKLSSPSVKLEGFRSVPVQGYLLDDFHLVAVESPSAILVLAVNGSQTCHASVEVLVAGVEDSNATNLSSQDNSVPAYNVPPESVQILAAFSIAGFQDYEYGFGSRKPLWGHVSNFHVSTGVVVHLVSEQTQPGENGGVDLTSIYAPRRISKS